MFSFSFLICLVPMSKNNPPDLIDNNLVTPSYDFDNPIYHAEEEGEEDCELPEELARWLKQEEKVIQPHEEQVELVNLGTEEVRKEVKVGAALEASVNSGSDAIWSQERRCHASKGYGGFVS